MLLDMLRLHLGLLFLLQSYINPVCSETLPQLQLPIPNLADIIWADNPNCAYSPTEFSPNKPTTCLSLPKPDHPPAWLQGIVIHNRTSLLPGQAVASIMIQGLYNLRYFQNNQTADTWSYLVSYPMTRPGFSFNVSITVTSLEQSGSYRFTYGRLGIAMGVLGTYLDRLYNLQEIPEWDFDVVGGWVKRYPTNETLRVIAKGRIFKPLLDEQSTASSRS